jgi:hypothetical protein
MRLPDLWSVLDPFSAVNVAKELPADETNLLEQVVGPHYMRLLAYELQQQPKKFSYEVRQAIEQGEIPNHLVYKTLTEFLAPREQAQQKLQPPSTSVKLHPVVANSKWAQLGGVGGVVRGGASSRTVQGQPLGPASPFARLPGIARLGQSAIPLLLLGPSRPAGPQSVLEPDEDLDSAEETELEDFPSPETEETDRT